MSEPTYTIKEILELQFSNLNRELAAIRETLEKQNVSSVLQFNRMDGEIEKMKAEVSTLREENAKYKVIWGVGATVGASLVAVISGRFF